MFDTNFVQSPNYLKDHVSLYFEYVQSHMNRLNKQILLMES